MILWGPPGTGKTTLAELIAHYCDAQVERVSAVTSGVAFLAAGSIIINGGNVRGVTTGASMWLCGAIGLCCGIGDVVLGAMATAMALVVLYLIQLLVKPVAEQMRSGDEEESGSDAGNADDS